MIPLGAPPGQPVDCSQFASRKFLVQKTGRGRGGLADRLLQMYDLAMVANVTNRILLLQWDDPRVPLDQYWEPHQYEWRYEKYASCFAAADVRTHLWMGYDGRQEMASVNVTEYFSARVEVITHNMNWLGLLARSNPFTKPVISNVLEQFPYWFADVTDTLYRPSRHLLDLVEPHLARWKNHTVAALQIRVFNPKWDVDDHTRNELPFVDTIVKTFAYCARRQHPRVSQFFVMSDQEVVLKTAKTLFKDQFYAADGPIIHSDRHSAADAASSAGNDRIFVELELLSRSQVVVLTRISGMGRLGAVRRRGHPMGINFLADVKGRDIGPHCCVQLNAITTVVKGSIYKPLPDLSYQLGINEK